MSVNCEPALLLIVDDIVVVAGKRCEWAELNWVFRLYKDESVNFDVSFYRENLLPFTSPSSTLVGSVSFTGEHILSMPTEADYTLQLIADLHRPGNDKGFGRLTAKVLVEKGEEWDWFVQLCELKERDQRQLKSIVRNLPKHYTQTTGIIFPFVIQFEKVELLDLWESVVPHGFLFKEYVHIELDLGSKSWNTAQSAATSTGSGRSNVYEKMSGTEVCWRELDWQVSVPGPESNLIFNLYRGQPKTQNLFGRYVFTGVEAMEAIHTSQMTLQIYGDIEEKGHDLTQPREEAIGKIVIMGRLVKEPPASTTSLPISSSSLACESAVHDISQEHRLHPAAEINSSWQEDSIQLPAILALEKIELVALDKSLLPDLALSTLCLSCAYRNFSSMFTKDRWSLDTEGLNKISFVDLNWDLPVKNRFFITCKIESNKSKTVLASMTLCADELILMKKKRLTSDKNSSWLIEIHRYLYGTTAIVGKIAFYGKIKSEGAVDTIDRLIANDRPSISPVLEGGNLADPSQLARNKELIQEVERDRFFVPSFPSRSKENVITSKTAVYPVAVTILDLILMDVRKAHFLAKNALFVTIVCGSASSRTTVQNNAGQHCQWLGLNTKLSVQQGSTIHLYIQSRKTILGELSLSIDSMLDIRPDGAGIREYYSVFTSTKSSNQSHGGKIKFRYFIDNAVPTDKTSGQSLSVKPMIEKCYPNLIVVYHIGFVNLPSVHLFAKNSPSLKLRYWIPKKGPVDYATPVLADGGAMGKWVNLLWEVLLFSSSSTVFLQVISDSIVIGEALVRAEQFFERIPDKYGICQLDCLLYLEDAENNDVNQPDGLFMQSSSLSNSNNRVDSLRLKAFSMKTAASRGMIRLSYTSEPYVSPQDALDYDQSIEDKEDASDVEQFPAGHGESSSDGGSLIMSEGRGRSVLLPSTSQSTRSNRDADSLVSMMESYEWVVDVEHIVFALQGSSRAKRFFSEGIVNVQLVCDRLVTALQLKEEQGQRYHSGPLSITLPLPSSHILPATADNSPLAPSLWPSLHLRLYDSNNREIGSCTYDLGKVLTRSPPSNGQDRSILSQESVFYDERTLMGHVRLRMAYRKQPYLDGSSSILGPISSKENGKTLVAEKVPDVVTATRSRREGMVLTNIPPAKELLATPFFLSIKRAIAYDLIMLDELLNDKDWHDSAFLMTALLPMRAILPMAE
eukprot:scaffold8581_cov181-Ochromonas_danica.AAC.2